MKLPKKFWFFVTLPFLMSSSAMAQVGGGVTGLLGSDPGGQTVSRPVFLIGLMLALSVLPFIIMMTTSFIKIAVVLALVRNALGTQQIPPNPIITGLAIILTIYIMTPTGIEMYRASESLINKGSNAPVLSEVTINLMVETIDKSKEPLRAFLEKHAHAEEKNLFWETAVSMRKAEDRDKVGKSDFLILIPAFVVSELSEAFQIGFIIFLPFLVVDIVVTNVLLALGMFQISPVTVALPFKLLLFVLVSGWKLIVQGLVQGYM